MTPDPIAITPETPTPRVAGLMIKHDISGLPVLDENELVGIVTKSICAIRDSQKISRRVGDLMEDAITVSRYHSLDHVIDLMRERNDKVIVIDNDGSLAGIITESNLAFFLYEDEKKDIPTKDVVMIRRGEYGGRKQLRYVMEAAAIAEDLMSSPVITITEDASIQEAVQMMQSHRINSLVVLEDNEIKGILKRDDIIREVAK